MRRTRSTATQMSLWRCEITHADMVRLKCLKHRFVLMTRSGSFGKQIWTLRELADWFGLTPERIRQIENKAICCIKYNSRRLLHD